MPLPGDGFALSTKSAAVSVSRPAGERSMLWPAGATSGTTARGRFRRRPRRRRRRACPTDRSRSTWSPLFARPVPDAAVVATMSGGAESPGRPRRKRSLPRRRRRRAAPSTSDGSVSASPLSLSVQPARSMASSAGVVELQPLVRGVVPGWSGSYMTSLILTAIRRFVPERQAWRDGSCSWLCETLVAGRRDVRGRGSSWPAGGGGTGVAASSGAPAGATRRRGRWCAGADERARA